MIITQKGELIEIYSEMGWVLGPATLCFSVCNWTNISCSNKMQINNKGLKITACMYSCGKLWTRCKKTKNFSCHFWSVKSKSRALCMIPAHSSTKAVGRPPKPPFSAWSTNPPLPSSHFKEPPHPPQVALWTRAPVFGFRSLLLQHESQQSLAWISHMASYRSLLIQESKSPG